MNSFRLKDGNYMNQKFNGGVWLLVVLMLTCIAISPMAQAVLALEAQHPSPGVQGGTEQVPGQFGGQRAVSQATQEEQPNAPESESLARWRGARDLVLIPLLLRFAPLLIAFFVLRAITVRLLLRYMMQRAPKPATEQAELEDAVPAGAVRGTPEVDFLNLNTTNGVLLNGSAQGRLERTEETGKRTLYAFQWSVLAGLTVCLVVLTLKVLRSPDDLFATEIAAGVAAIFFLWSLLVGWFLYWGAKRLVFSAAVFLVLLTAGLGIVGSVMKLAPPYLTLLPAIAQGFTVWYLMARVRRTTLADGNRRLLILRVFGSDKSTAFTFGTLMAKWRFVGSFLTIVDPSYVRYQFAALNPLALKRTLAASLWYSLAAMLALLVAKLLVDLLPDLMPTALSTMSEDQKARYLQNAGLLILTPVAILPLFLYVKTRFAKSADDAAQRIAKGVESGKRLRLGGVFRGSRMWCFDDVWKPSVRHMLSASDAVLMDLRGFTPERKGCVYEIGELVDHFPIDRVLFLVRADADKHALYDLIRQRWSQMSAESPNRGAQKALIKVYETNPKAKARQVRRDVTRILALLSVCVDEKAGAGEPAKGLVQFA
jgi:hypothetical protein